MQQFSFIDIFINLFESALHVSSDKHVHLPEHLLTVYTVKKSAPEDGRVCRSKHVEKIQIDQ